MNKRYPFSERGITLIELLVVVAIIAVLSMIGLINFGRTRTAARNAKRVADVQAIGKAYEVNFDQSTGYQLLSASDDFANGLPTPPGGGSYNLVSGPGTGACNQVKICTPLEPNTANCNTAAVDCYCYVGQYAIDNCSIAVVPSSTTPPAGPPGPAGSTPIPTSLPFIPSPPPTGPGPTSAPVAAGPLVFNCALLAGSGGITVNTELHVTGAALCSNNDVSVGNNCDVEGSVGIAGTGHLHCPSGGTITSGVEIYNITANSDLNVYGEAHYTTANSFVNFLGTQYPNSPPASDFPMPIAESKIDYWSSLSSPSPMPPNRAAITTACPSDTLPGGVYPAIDVPSSCEVTFTGPIVVGNIHIGSSTKINTKYSVRVDGDVSIGNDGHLILGTVTYITGALTINNDTHIELDPSLGNKSGVFVVDGKIAIKNSAQTAGTPDPSTNLLLISRYNSQATGSEAIKIAGDFYGIAYANSGLIRIQAIANVGMLVGWKISAGNALYVDKYVDINTLNLP